MMDGQPPCVPAGLRSQQAYLPALETLRGIAILLVVLFHYHGILGGPRSPDTSLALRVIAAGNTGVTLFFVLSGFLLARPFGGLDYRHDAVMLTVTAMVAAMALWLHWDAVRPLFPAAPTF